MTCRFLAVAALAIAAAAPTHAQGPDSAAFVIRLGHDTTVIERYVRSADRIVMEAVQRAPSTMLHRMELHTDAKGLVTHAEYTQRAPGGGEPVLRRETRFAGDSAIITTTQGGQTRTQRAAARAAIPMVGPFYTPYELVVMRAFGGNAPKADVPLLAGANVVTIPVQRVGSDSVTLENQFGEPMRAHVDARGRLLHLHTPAFTTLERARWIDLDALAREFAERDRTGRGMGPLSPRHASRTRVGEANLWLDYSRPAMRGRPVWGRLVPWGQVWRMGANDAAHFATDRTIQLGDLTVEPGTYTLFLLPTEQQWTLIVNRATGMSGLAYDAAKDVGRVALATQDLATPAEQFTLQIEGAGADARLAIQWGPTRGTVPLRVR